MNRTTALAIRASASQILKIDDNWENVDIRHLDVENLIARFRNLSKLTPGSLTTYESRFRSGLASYIAYLENPTSYQPRGRKSSVRDDKPSPSPKRKSAAEPTAGPSSAFTTTPIVSSSAKLVVYPFPVRPDVFAELKLPADLTVDEAGRLSAFLKAIALTDAGGTE